MNKHIVKHKHHGHDFISRIITADPWTGRAPVGPVEAPQIIGPKGDTKVAWRDKAEGVAALGDGRLFVSDGTSVVMLS